MANWATLGSVNYYTNAFSTLTKGVDFVVNYDWRLGPGRLGTTLSANYNETKVTDWDPTVLSREVRANIEGSLPKIKGNLRQTWSNDRWHVFARANFHGSHTVHSDVVAVGGDKKFGGEVTFDLEVSYDVTDKFSVAIGGDNIFDNYPDKDCRAIGQPNQTCFVSTGTNSAGFIYNDSAPIGYNGGFWYLRLNSTF